jgi:CubicO group peptidase (beta-lactamase class C family)
MSLADKMAVANWSRVDEAMRSASHSFSQGAPSGPESSGNAARSALGNSAFPGAVLSVGLGGETVYHRAFGCRSVVPEKTRMQEDTVFDVASLTKVLVSTFLTMGLVDRGQLEVDRRLSRIFQTFNTHGKERMTIRHLLTHTSGYPATFPYFRTLVKADKGVRSGVLSSRAAIDMVYQEIFRAKLENLPGKVTKYSDVGFILLGHAIELLGGMSLDKLCARNIVKPLGLKNTGFIEHAALRRKGLEPVNEMIAPTAHCSWRGRLLSGEVHDDNAWAMGGIAAHAGVFSNASDIHLICRELIEAYHGRSQLLSKDVVRKFWTRDDIDPKSTWALGWDTPSPEASSAGRYFGPNSVGHLSYTGCSVWIDPDREIDVILLSNRIHPSIENKQIAHFRPLIHDLVMETLGVS